MFKFLLLLIVFAAAYWLLRRAARLPRPPRHPRVRSMPPPENMVVCGHCGVHQPVSESVESAGRYFCCENHRRAFIAEHGGGRR